MRHEVLMPVSDSSCRSVAGVVCCRLFAASCSLQVGRRSQVDHGRVSGTARKLWGFFNANASLFIENSAYATQDLVFLTIHVRLCSVPSLSSLSVSGRSGMRGVLSRRIASLGRESHGIRSTGGHALWTGNEAESSVMSRTP